MSEIKNLSTVVGVEIGKVNATNGTENYGLPIFVATDKPSWLLDWNGAMTAIDSLLKQIESKSSISETELDALKVQMSSAEESITALQDSLGSLTTNVNGMKTEVDGFKVDIDTMQQTVLQLSSTVKKMESDINVLKKSAASHDTEIVKILRHKMLIGNGPLENMTPVDTIKNVGDISFIATFQDDNKIIATIEKYISTSVIIKATEDSPYTVNKNLNGVTYKLEIYTKHIKEVSGTFIHIYYKNTTTNKTITPNVLLFANV